MYYYNDQVDSESLLARRATPPPRLPERITPMPQGLYAETYGGGLICSMAMLVLYGLSLIQAYMYFSRYKMDHRALQLLVAVIGFLGTLHAIFVCHLVYHYLITTFTNPLMLVDGVWSVYTATLIGVLICPIIQCFFARTIVHLVKKPWRVILTVVLGVLIVAQLALGLYLCVREYQIWRLADLHQLSHSAMIPLFSVRVACDAIIATALCLCFHDAKGMAASRKTLGMLNWLIVYAINRFVLTAAVVLAQAIILIIMPHALYAMEFEFFIIHLYINSFLATLNTRQRLRSKFRAGTISTTPTLTMPSTTIEFSGELDRPHASGDSEAVHTDDSRTRRDDDFEEEEDEGRKEDGKHAIPLGSLRGES